MALRFGSPCSQSSSGALHRCAMSYSCPGKTSFPQIALQLMTCNRRHPNGMIGAWGMDYNDLISFHLGYRPKWNSNNHLQTQLYLTEIFNKGQFSVKLPSPYRHQESQGDILVLKVNYMLTGHLQLYMLFPLCSCSMILCLKWRLRQAVLYTCSCSLICFFLLAPKPGLKLMIQVKKKTKKFSRTFMRLSLSFPTANRGNSAKAALLHPGVVTRHKEI